MSMIHNPGFVNENPADKSCWQYCTSCGRCRHKSAAQCPMPNTCSGRYDPKRERESHPDDYCRCTEGILQWVTKEGRWLQVKMTSNPFAGTVQYENTSQDEADWDSYVNDAREKLDDPNYDPIRITE